MEPLDVRRYQLPGPPPGRMTDVHAWKQALDNSRAQLEAQRVRGVNLDLMQVCPLSLVRSRVKKVHVQEYGAETWRRYCSVLEYHMKNSQKELDGLQVGDDELSALAHVSLHASERIDSHPCATKKRTAEGRRGVGSDESRVSSWPLIGGCRGSRLCSSVDKTSLASDVALSHAQFLKFG